MSSTRSRASPRWGCSGCWVSVASGPRGRGWTSWGGGRLRGRELLTDAVEVDERLYRRGPGGRGARGKAIVAIAVEDRGERAGRVRMRRIPDVTKDTLTEFVLDHVARG